MLFVKLMLVHYKTVNFGALPAREDLLTDIERVVEQCNDNGSDI